jgi:hypothetical protein
MRQQSIVLSTTAEAQVDLVAEIMCIAASDECRRTDSQDGYLWQKYKLFHGVNKLNRSAAPCQRTA